MWCTKTLERKFGECMYVVVDTEYHHHVLSDGGLGVVFVVENEKIIESYFMGDKAFSSKYKMITLNKFIIN